MVPRSPPIWTRPMQIRRSWSAIWRTFSQAVGKPSRGTSTEPNTFSTTPGWPIQSRGCLRAYRLLPPKDRRSYTKACTRYLARVTSSSSSQRLRLAAYPLAFTTSSALKRVGSPSTGIRLKRFHLAINGKTATASSSAVRGRTYASRHVWKKIGGAFFSAGVFLTCAWSQGTLSGCVDTYANAERLSWTHCTHSTRKGFFDIRAPAPSRQH